MRSFRKAALNAATLAMLVLSGCSSFPASSSPPLWSDVAVAPAHGGPAAGGQTPTPYAINPVSNQDTAANFGAVAEQSPTSASIIRGQSPTGSGGYPVAPLPQDPYIGPGSVAPAGQSGPPGAPAAGPGFVPAGYGVNQWPTTVYQAPSPPPGPVWPTEGAGALPTGFGVTPPVTPFTSPSPLVFPEEIRNENVFVQEAPSGRVMLGVGVTSDAGVIGNIVIDEQNFDISRPSLTWQDWVNGTAYRGGGEHLRVEIMPGTEVSRYSASFEKPYWLDTPLSLGLSAFYFERQYDSWLEKRGGARINLGYIFPDRRDLALTASIGAENVEIENPVVPTPPELQEVLGNNMLYTARVQLTHDTRDSTFLPTQGHYIGLTFEEGFGDFTFPRYEGDFRQYWLVGERPDHSGRQVLGLSGKLGVSGSDTPLFEHFFAGGFSSLRGFAFRGASPLDEGVQVGGDFEALTSAEYRFPLTASDFLFGAFFVDAGVISPVVEFKNQDLRVSTGFELRINVPALGPVPIALGLGVPLKHAPGDQIENFYFYLGISR